MVRQKTLLLFSLIFILALVAGCAVPAAAPTGSAGGDSSTAAPAEGPQGTLTIGLTTDIAAVEVPYSPERQAAVLSSMANSETPARSTV